MGGMQPAERRRRAGALPNFFQAKYQIMRLSRESTKYGILISRVIKII